MTGEEGSSPKDVLRIRMVRSLPDSEKSHPPLAARIAYLRERGAFIGLLEPGGGKPVAFEDFRIDRFAPPQAAYNLVGIAQGLALQESYQGFTPEELIVHLQFQIYRDHAPFSDLLRQGMADIDVVVLEHPYLARIVGPICKEAGKPLLLLSHELLFQNRTTNEKSRKLLLANEVDSLRAADFVLFGSEADRQAFAAYGIKGAVGTDPAAHAKAISRLAGKALAAPRPRGLILLQHDLVTIAGHGFNYGKSIFDAAGRAGVPCRIFGAVGLSEEIRSQVGAIPVFRHDALDAQGRYAQAHFAYPEPETPEAAQALHDYVVANIQFHNDMKRALSRIRSDDVLLMPDLDHRQLLAWSWLLQEWPAHLCPEVVLLFHYTYHRSSGTASGDLLDPSYWFAAHALSALQQAARGRKVRLLTDSEGLAKEYGKWTTLPIEVAPIPHTAGPLSPVPSSFLPPKQAGRLRFVNIGEARAEKGFILLTLALKLLAQRPDFGEMEFVLQSFIGHAYHAPMEPVVAEVRRLAGPNVTIVDGVLSGEQYHELLTSADVVLVPYQRTAYFSRTSGIFTEAITNGKPVVVTDQTWMSGQLGDSGAGVIFSDTSPENLAEAILTARRDFPKLQENVLKLRESYMAYHNPDSFLRAIMGSPVPS